MTPTGPRMQGPKAYPVMGLKTYIKRALRPEREAGDFEGNLTKMKQMGKRNIGLRAHSN